MITIWNWSNHYIYVVWNYLTWRSVWMTSICANNITDGIIFDDVKYDSISNIVCTKAPQVSTRVLSIYKRSASQDRQRTIKINKQERNDVKGRQRRWKLVQYVLGRIKSSGDSRACYLSCLSVNPLPLMVVIFIFLTLVIISRSRCHKWLRFLPSDIGLL